MFEFSMCSVSINIDTADMTFRELLTHFPENGWIESAEFITYCTYTDAGFQSFDLDSPVPGFSHIWLSDRPAEQSVIINGHRVWSANINDMTFRCITEKYGDDDKKYMIVKSGKHPDRVWPSNYDGTNNLSIRRHVQ